MMCENDLQKTMSMNYSKNKTQKIGEGNWAPKIRGSSGMFSTA